MIAPAAGAQDVYNFYFQKTDHTNEMVQVKNGEAVSADKKEIPARIETGGAPPVAAAPAAISVAANVSPVAGEKKNFWRLTAAAGTFVDKIKRVEKSYALNVEYGFNKYFGLDAQVMAGKATEIYNDAMSGIYEHTYFTGALGLKVTPVHVELFGYDFIDVAADVGAMTAASYGASGIRVAPYWGTQVDLNIVDRLAFVVDGRFQDFDTRYGQLIAGLGYKF